MSERPYPWEKSYPPGVRWDAPIATTTLPALLERAVAAGIGGCTLDYPDWADRLRSSST
jgi:long-chain acyl-CoA synthetase